MQKQRSRSTLPLATLGLATFGLTALGACGAPQSSDDYAQLESSLTVCPGSSVLQGIDVSYYQGTIDWNKVKAAGKSFAIVRVSDGTGYLDPKFEANWKGSAGAGVVHGAYQFFRPGQSATAQAQLMINKLRAVGFGGHDIPPVLDVEVTDKVSAANIVAGIRTWVNLVHSTLGRTPIIYTSPGFWPGIGNPTIANASLWDAHWGVSCPSVPSGWSSWKFWQYSSTGSVSGISGNVDLDRFNGTMSQLTSL